MLIHLCALIVPIELQAQDVWRSLAQLEDPRLQQLSQKLYGTVMSSMGVGTNFKVGGLKLCSRSLKQGVWGAQPPRSYRVFHCNTDTFFIQ